MKEKGVYECADCGNWEVFHDGVYAANCSVCGGILKLIWQPTKQEREEFRTAFCADDGTKTQIKFISENNIDPVFTGAAVLRPEPGDSVVFFYKGLLSDAAYVRLSDSVREQLRLPESVGVAVLEECAGIALIKALHTGGNDTA